MSAVNCVHDGSDDKAKRPQCALGVQGGQPGPGWCQEHCKRRVERGTPPAGVLAKAEAYYAAGRSMVATRLVPGRKASDAEIVRRLAICGACPGDHAIKRKDGTPVSCGPLLKGEVGTPGKACGCYLAEKARDTQQACPFGYWEQKPAAAPVQAPGKGDAEGLQGGRKGAAGAEQAEGKRA